MRLSWNEIRARAARFAAEWANATYERGEAQSERWILWLGETPPDLLRQAPALHKRVRAFRQQSKSAPTRKLAETPTLYHVNVIPGAPFLSRPEGEF